MTQFRASGIVLILALAACASSPKDSSPTPKQVWDGIKYGLIFGITPDANGVLQKCRFDSANDVHTKAKSDFVPPDAVVKDACGKLANGTWKVDRAGDGGIQEVYMFCYYSTVVPDTAVCDARYGVAKPDPAKP